jgi:hypothetical protein
VYIDDEELGTAEPTRDFRNYTFAIPGKLAAVLAQRTVPSQIRIQSTTWNPQETLGGPDNRHLGEMVDRAEIR